MVRALASHNVSRVRFPDPVSYVGWVCCWFSILLREVFLRVLWFSPLLKNQHFQSPIRSWNTRAFLNEFFELLGAPWVNKLHYITLREWRSHEKVSLLWSLQIFHFHPPNRRNEVIQLNVGGNMKFDSNVDSLLTVANLGDVKWSWQAYTTSTIHDNCTLTILRSVIRPFMSLHSCLWRALHVV